MQIRCNFPDISYLSETQTNNFQFLNTVQYLVKQEPISFTPVSYLTSVAPQGQFFIGAKLFPGTPSMRKKCSPKTNLFGLICENA